MRDIPSKRARKEAGYGVHLFFVERAERGAEVGHAMTLHLDEGAKFLNEIKARDPKVKKLKDLANREVHLHFDPRSEGFSSPVGISPPLKKPSEKGFLFFLLFIYQ